MLGHPSCFGNIDYWVKQSRQGQGIATRAVRLVAPFDFSRIGLTRLEFVAVVNNYASRRVAEKVERRSNALPAIG
ncbi:putative ribosomal-protein-serine acetyltransferase [Methylocaldum marinum]|uniref:Putative ribosomal-protein-serine acetyltransferase n=1 Tax=Methylocaldum marinum TaxID=1432792 RepID=A0A250KXQ4_9GAMM|nr:GNAT family protein [Methylocaldum marinum]BBA36306.1 putative ribosomal-protein-serine acetyltransferase [Methylocaldum marinum]